MNQVKRKFDVIVIGELNVDIILTGMGCLPEIGKEIIAGSMSVTLGSSSAIFASNLSSLGSRVAFIGKIGDDNFAEIVLSSLEGKNVDTSNIIRLKTVNTGATVVLNYGQDRANVTYPGAMNELKLADIDFNFLAQARHLHFANCFMQPGIRDDIVMLFKKAKELGLTVSFDTQWDPEEKWDLPLNDLLPFVDIFMPNYQEFLYLTRSNSIDEGIRKIADRSNLIVIKNGSKGAYAWDGKKLIHQHAFKNDKVVDCIGAGDSFNAGFITTYINKSSLEKCLETGALTGAINTTAAGGTTAFRDLESIRKIASEKFNYSL